MAFTEIGTEEGMLLLAPKDESNPWPTIWTVEKDKVIIAYTGQIKMRTTLAEPKVPKGWTVLSTRALADLLIENDDLRNKVCL